MSGDTVDDLGVTGLLKGFADVNKCSHRTNRVAMTVRLLQLDTGFMVFEREE